MRQILRGILVLFCIGGSLFPQYLVRAETFPVIYFSLEIVPVRIIVVDEEQNILEIWNLAGNDTGYFELQARLGSNAGPPLALDEGILEQYKTLLPYLDFGAPDRKVFDASDSFRYKYNEAVYIEAASGSDLEVYTHTN